MEHLLHKKEMYQLQRLDIDLEDLGATKNEVFPYQLQRLDIDLEDLGATKSQVFPLARQPG